MVFTYKNIYGYEVYIPINIYVKKYKWKSYHLLNTYYVLGIMLIDLHIQLH